MMNDIFHMEVINSQVLIYLDDILIFSKTLDEHHRQVHRVMEILREHKLYLKPEKCQFDALETEYLRMIISEGNIKMDPVKTEGIANWPMPKDKHDVQSFLSFCNFYHHFILNYSKEAQPLTALTGNVPFKWTDEHGKAFK
jgi:Reverse transcriptase (RNA-dependent DNA polymerase)